MPRSSDPRSRDSRGGDRESESLKRPSDYDDGNDGRVAPQKVESPDIGFVGWLRWFWRQLTSMRVALVLLLLLAVAAIPGSLVPQRSADPNGVLQYQSQHPELFKFLDAFPIQAFDVYGSVWFSAIYLLLFISLIGCVLPRILHHARALRGRPPKTPARLQRMAGFSELKISNPDASAAERDEFAERAVAEAAGILKRQRYRTEIQRVEGRGTRPGSVSVSAERGYLRETGNLVFHLSLVGVLLSVALGGAFSFNGQKVLVEGDTLLNQLIDYDSANSGRSFDDSSLEPFRMRLDELDVQYVTPNDKNAKAIGQVLDYIAHVTLINPDGSKSKDQIRVNHPLRVHGSPIYLIANGYAPTITIRDPKGTVVYSESMPFIPQDNSTLTSLGVLKVPYGLKDTDGKATQVGLRGFFYPTKADLDTGAFTSNYPDLLNPMLTLDVFTGDLGIDQGIPQSVFALDTSKMTQLTGRAVDKKSIELKPGQSTELPNGMGTITLDKVPRYASFDVMQNPAQVYVLVFALAALGGLLTSLFVPRRRMWVKAQATEDGVVLQYAGLARGDDPTLERAVAELREQHRQQV